MDVLTKHTTHVFFCAGHTLLFALLFVFFVQRSYLDYLAAIPFFDGDYTFSIWREHLFPSTIRVPRRRSVCKNEKIPTVEFEATSKKKTFRRRQDSNLRVKSQWVSNPSP